MVRRPRARDDRLMDQIYYIGAAATRPGGTPFTAADFAAAARAAGLPAYLLRAIADVESAASGYLDDGRVRILFEAHVFARETDGRHNGSHPDVSSKRWNRDLYRGGAAEYARLARAAALDPLAAHRSASWGAGQIMGFNHASAGYASVAGMVREFADSPAAQLEAIAAYLASRGLDDPLRRLDFAAVARGYNGAGFAANDYHRKLATAAAARFSPALAMLALGRRSTGAGRQQRRLAAAGYDPGPIDAVWGQKSADALLAYQRATGRPVA